VIEKPHKARLRTPFVLARSSRFAYECRACKRCCRHKTIPVTPYEVACIAAALGTSTTVVLTRFTDHGGATLAVREDGTCVFLGTDGCTVHAGRPIACRLYPLGRKRDGDGTERFAELAPHPASEGVYGEGGTVEEFLGGQDVDRHLAETDRYLEVLKRMMEALARAPEAGDVRDDATAALGRPPVAEDGALLDMDVVVERWCLEHGRTLPRDVESKNRLHLEALDAFVVRLEERRSGVLVSADRRGPSPLGT
jgi:hypothetical protein